MIERSDIRKFAIEAGFSLKEQPDGSMDLNPYVYEFARRIESEAQGEIVQLFISKIPNRPGAF
jgi:hypothetical protein